MTENGTIEDDMAGQVGQCEERQGDVGSGVYTGHKVGAKMSKIALQQTKQIKMAIEEALKQINDTLAGNWIAWYSKVERGRRNVWTVHN